ncbi:MAG: HD-GYP domain-containing protein [Leptospirales bacterium]
MNKYLTISIDNLRIGHYVVGIDKSWLETPFLAHRFLIKSAREIEQMKSFGIKRVTVDPDRSLDNSESPTDQSIHQEDAPEAIPLQREVPSSPFQKMELLTSLHEHLVRKFRTLFAGIRGKSQLSEPLDTAPFLNAVGEAEQIGRDYPDSYLFLAHLQSSDDETFVHSINTMFLSLYMAQSQKSSREENILWGLAGLFHDLGKVRVPLEILRKREPLTPEEREIIKDHPRLGETLIRTHTNLPDIVAKVAGEHHLRKDGSGYPDSGQFDGTDAVTRAVMIIDTFDDLISDRSYHSGTSPSKALKTIVDVAKDLLDAKWTTNFFLGMGVYPIGTVLELSEGEIGVVTKYHPHQETVQPQSRLEQQFSVMILKNRNGFPLTTPILRRITWSPMVPPPVSKTYNHSDFMIDWELIQGYSRFWTE